MSKALVETFDTAQLVCSAPDTCSGLRTETRGLANKGMCGPALCANTRQLGLTLSANEPALVCEGLANKPVGQHTVRME